MKIPTILNLTPLTRVRASQVLVSLLAIVGNRKTKNYCRLLDFKLNLKQESTSMRVQSESEPKPTKLKKVYSSKLSGCKK